MPAIPKSPINPSRRTPDDAFSRFLRISSELLFSRPGNPRNMRAMARTKVHEYEQGQAICAPVETSRIVKRYTTRGSSRPEPRSLIFPPTLGRSDCPSCTATNRRCLVSRGADEIGQHAVGGGVEAGIFLGEGEAREYVGFEIDVRGRAGNLHLGHEMRERPEDA